MEWAGGLRKQRSVWQGQAAAGGEDALWLEASPSPHALLISLTPAGEAFAGRWQEGSFVTFGSPILSGPALLLALSGGSQRLWPSPSCPAVGLRVRRPYIKARCQGNNGWNGYVKPWSPGEGESCRRQSSTQSRPPLHMGERESDPPHCMVPTSCHWPHAASCPALDPGAMGSRPSEVSFMSSKLKN